MRLLLVLLCAQTVSAQILAPEPEQPTGFHEHDGFFLSLSTGLGYANVEDRWGGAKLTYDGLNGSFDVRIGGSIAQNLILSGDLMGWSLSDPKVSGYGTLGNTSLIQSTVGVGLTYYFMPANIFVSGTVGLAGFSLDAGGNTTSSDTGVGLYLKAGKDWWVGADWGLGVAATFGWSSVKTATTSGDEKLSGYSVGLQFNATYQ